MQSSMRSSEETMVRNSVSDSSVKMFSIESISCDVELTFIPFEAGGRVTSHHVTVIASSRRPEQCAHIIMSCS